MTKHLRNHHLFRHNRTVILHGRIQGEIFHRQAGKYKAGWYCQAVYQSTTARRTLSDELGPFESEEDAHQAILAWWANQQEG